jgi:hypothetical protein
MKLHVRRYLSWRRKCVKVGAGRVVIKPVLLGGDSSIAYGDYRSLAYEDTAMTLRVIQIARRISNMVPD